MLLSGESRGHPQGHPEIPQSGSIPPWDIYILMKAFLYLIQTLRLSELSVQTFSLTKTFAYVQSVFNKQKTKVH